jgi:hypothetical protein
LPRRDGGVPAGRPRLQASRPLNKGGLNEKRETKDGKEAGQLVGPSPFLVFRFQFAIQDAFVSILLGSQ